MNAQSFIKIYFYLKLYYCLRNCIRNRSILVTYFLKVFEDKSTLLPVGTKLNRKEDGKNVKDETQVKD